MSPSGSTHHIVAAFPKLAADPFFRITSKKDPNYNCIAWSALRTNVIVWPFATPLDGTHWPPGIPRDCSLATFQKFYEGMEYQACNTHYFEDKYQKIAVYVDPTSGNCTHAARQRPNGIWTSKLGPQEDIEHQDPYSLTSSAYGNVALIMKRPNTSYQIAKISDTGLLPPTATQS